MEKDRAQLTERLLLTSDSLGLNPVSGNFNTFIE